MAVHGTGEALEIVIDEKDPDKLESVRLRDRDVPGSGDRKGDQSESRIPFFPFAATAAKEQIGRER